MRAVLPALASGQLLAEAYASRREYPSEDFFGVGPASARGDRSDFLMLTNRYGGRAGVRPIGALLVGGGLDYIKPHIGVGRDDALPSTADVFDETYADSAPLSAELLRNGTLKTYKGFPHGMPSTEADTINADLLAFVSL